ncbi:hypothetical protein OAC51_03890 [Flavobacteriaceae bacterium]|nr:hypothetical protein [Flavobacteriaceae bacterium]
MKKITLIILFSLISVNVFSQVHIHIGPFNTFIPDPLAHYQERRMAVTEGIIAANAALIASPMGVLDAAVKAYSTNLVTPAPQYSLLLLPLVNVCAASALLDHLTAGLPGLGALDVVNAAKTAVKINSLRALYSTHVELMLPDNPMTDGERKLMSLRIIRIILKTAIDD